MNKTINFLKNIQYYPLLIGVYPALVLFNVYIVQFHFTVVFRVFFFMLLLVSFLLLGTSVFVENKQTAALLTTAFLFLFYAYGPVYAYLDYIFPGLIQHLSLSLVWLLIASALSVVLSKKTIRREISQFLTIFSTVLLILGLIKPIRFEMTKSRTNQNHAQAFLMPDTAPSLDYLPDIYYIILDGHTRSDVLLNAYAYDDIAFVNKLTALGFFVAECSQTNYWRTEFSVNSALNMAYIDPQFGDTMLQPDWAQSRVRKILDGLGYTTISFETRAINMNHQDIGADIVYNKNENTNTYRIIKNLNTYELRFAEITWLRFWLMGLAVPSPNPALTFNDVISYDNFNLYQEINYILENLEEIPKKNSSPKFVYAHIFTPHIPFIFNPDGSYNAKIMSYQEGYKNNTIFIDTEIALIAEKILKQSENPPIIIIQGDHGRHGDGPVEHSAILNAYYLPADGNQNLYDTISPINSFRVIFDTYFSTDYGLLEDKSHFAYPTQRTLSDYEVVPNLCGTNNR